MNNHYLTIISAEFIPIEETNHLKKTRPTTEVMKKFLLEVSLKVPLKFM